MSLVFVDQEKSTSDAVELYNNVIIAIKAITPTAIADNKIFLYLNI